MDDGDADAEARVRREIVLAECAADDLATLARSVGRRQPHVAVRLFGLSRSVRIHALGLRGLLAALKASRDRDR